MQEENYTQYAYNICIYKLTCMHFYMNLNENIIEFIDEFRYESIYI